MLVLGIESTCDETACSIVKDGRDILSNVVTSQIDLHREYGGVVPELACRRHVDLIIPVIDKALEQAKVTMNEIDLIAVAQGPGLIGALLIGINTAKALALAFSKPIIAVNHVEAHLYAALMSQPKEDLFPSLGVVLSGGHTALVLMKEVGYYEPIGQTVDDAIGEAFDKVAKILGLPYPGGPEIELLAEKGNSMTYPFKAGNVKGKPLCFSFSGLKTSVLYTVRGQNAGFDLPSLTIQNKQDIAASFQFAAFSDIVNKTILAARQYRCQNILFGGGVTNNKKLRRFFIEADSSLNYLLPSVGLSLDNAAMIAGLGYHTFHRKGRSDELDFEAIPTLNFE